MYKIIIICGKFRLHFYNFKKSTAENYRLLAETDDKHALSNSMCKRLFKQFKEGLVYVKDAELEVKNFEHHWIKCNTQTQQEALQNH